MAAINNTTKAADIEHALDVEMNLRFKGETDRLMEVLGIVSPEVVAAGTAMYQYTVTGSLSTATVAEGDEVPLSKYAVSKTPIGELELMPFRKMTTAQAVLKGGYRNAVVRTDDKMVKDVRALIVDKFFSFLANGTGTAQGETLQAALAYADAALEHELEQRGDNAGRIVHFVNRFDIADYLAKANVTTQTVFGMTYLENFLGVEHMFVTSKVPAGTLYVTPASNIHLYGVDFGALGEMGLSYTSLVGSLIGVHHEAAYNRVSAITDILTGAALLAEVKNYIVKAKIGKALDDMTVDELKAYAAANSIDITGKTTKADILAAIKAAEE